MNSNNTLARVSGFLYLITIIAGGFAEAFVREGLTVYGDPVATAHNILSSEQMYRLGFVADLLVILCGTFLTLIFYILFKPVNKNISLLAFIFGNVAAAVMAVNLLNQLAPLLLLHNSSYQTTFSIEQLQTLSLFFLNLQSQGYNISLFLFAFYFPIIGYLIYTSNILPRFLGILYALAGLGYLINSLGWFLLPHLAKYLFPYVLLPAFIGEVSMSLWLIFKGVEIQKTGKLQYKHQ
ncbi:MAG: DUF4386 domain-containing protein [Saprospiraceae bacterium]|uniref:DUF4386 domain-containing protein n=1 Tax=Candidatus Opimibacter skivensis TaxID=2982028 RepID=A0A9D7T044_9BACT|nr:DUF4386 domain-containing protein [Candidatus Opimibacter skivensis]